MAKMSDLCECGTSSEASVVCWKCEQPTVTPPDKLPRVLNELMDATVAIACEHHGGIRSDLPNRP